MVGQYDLNMGILQKSHMLHFVRCHYQLLVITHYFADTYNKLLIDKEIKSRSRTGGTWQNIFSYRHFSIFRQNYGGVFDNLKLASASKVKEQTSVHDNGNYHYHDCDVCNEILYVAAKLNAVRQWQLSWLP